MTTPAHPQRCVDESRMSIEKSRWKAMCSNFRNDTQFQWGFGCTCSGKVERLSIEEIRQTEKRGCASHSSVQSRDQVLDEVIKVIRKKVSLPTNSGEQISCDASIRLGIIHDINKELRTQESRDP